MIGWSGRVAELDVLEVHVARGSCSSGSGVGRVRSFRRGVDDLEDPFGAGQRRLDRVVQVGQLAQRAG